MKPNLVAVGRNSRQCGEHTTIPSTPLEEALLLSLLAERVPRLLRQEAIAIDFEDGWRGEKVFALAQADMGERVMALS